MLPLSRGAESSLFQWEARDCLGPWWLRPLVVRWLSPGNVVALAGSVASLVWPHVLASGSMGRPVMVPEPPWPQVCSAASAGSAKTY